MKYPDFCEGQISIWDFDLIPDEILIQLFLDRLSEVINYVK